MRVLVIGINYWPEKTGIGPFTTRISEYLVSRGHRVSVITGLPYYPEWHVPRSYRRRITYRELRDGVSILRSWLYVPRRATTTRRIVHEATFVGLALLRTLLQIRRERPDVIFLVSPPIGLAASAIMASRRWNIPYVMRVEDLQPDAAIDLGMLKPGRLVRAALRLERSAYREAALVSTLTEGMRNRIVSKGIPADKVTVVAHGVDDSVLAIPLAAEGAAVRRRFGLERKFLVLHSGNMGVKQGLEVVLEAARRSRPYADITYVLLGDGAARASLETRAAQLGLANVRFLPIQPLDIFQELLATTEVALITQQRTVANIVFPSKTQTLLASGRAVIASVNPGSEVAHVIRSSGAGIVVPPEDPDVLMSAALQLRADTASRLEAGRKGREYARENWRHDELLRLMEGHLTSAAARSLPVEAMAASSEENRLEA